MQVTMRSTPQEVSALSGGNQQKVLLGRVISRTPRLLLMYDATRGVDVGTKTEIYCADARGVRAGAAILFYSTDAAELANLSDRVIVLHDGAHPRGAERRANSRRSGSSPRGGGRSDGAVA